MNLGCGQFKKEGYVNLDYVKETNPDILHDLNKLPYPLKNGEFDLVEADHILEHLTDPFAVMRELHRITKRGGQVIIRAPHFSRGFTHPEHKRGFDVSFPLYFNPKFQGGYMGVNFKSERTRLRWFAQKKLKKQVLSRFNYYAASVLGGVIDFFGNLSPMLCSKLWCFLVGGFDEIEFVLTRQD